MANAERDLQFNKLRSVLEHARRERRTMTYLQAADAIGIEPPRRIHKLARLVEVLLQQDVEARRTPIAALVVSRARAGLPAPGFFDHARQLGIFDDSDPRGFHDRLLDSLFESPGRRE